MIIFNIFLTTPMHYNIKRVYLGPSRFRKQPEALMKPFNPRIVQSTSKVHEPKASELTGIFN